MPFLMSVAPPASQTRTLAGKGDHALSRTRSMDRSNVDSVFVAGQPRKWRGELAGFDVDRLRSELEASRDSLFQAAGIEKDLFRA